jgi:hypothetical protein
MSALLIHRGAAVAKARGGRWRAERHRRRRNPAGVADHFHQG